MPHSMSDRPCSECGDVAGWSATLGNAPIEADRTVGETVDTLKIAFADAIQVASELFPGDVEIERRHDPEFPQSSAIVVSVTASGDPADIIRRQREWHKRTRATVHNSDESLSLLILATE